MQLDKNYIENLENEVERLENEIERFKNTYETLALACAKGSQQIKIILNQTPRGWQDPEVYTSWGKKQPVDVSSRKNLYERITKANVAHLRKKTASTEEVPCNFPGLSIEKSTVEYIRTEYGPPPADVPTKTYRGMVYYVY